jgi:signal transduction histidine kinase
VKLPGLDSLRGRMVATLMAASLVAWFAWTVVEYTQAVRERSGFWDDNMRNSAKLVLTSLPRSLLTAGAERSFELPQGEQLGTQSEFNYQIWTADQRLAAKSLSAPAVPMNASFEPGFHQPRIDQQEWRVYTMWDAERQVQVQYGERLTQRADAVTQEVRSRLADIGIFVALLAASLLVVGNWTLRPVKRLSEHLATRDPVDATPLPLAGLPAELTPMVAAFNELLERTAAARDHEQRFLADAAHELRTPLAALRVQSQVARRARNEAQRAQALDELVSGIDRCTRLAEQMLELARVDAAAAQPRVGVFDLNAVAEDVVAMLSGQAAQQRSTLQLVLSGDAPLPAHGDDALVTVALRNVVDNALRYSPAGSCVRVQTETDSQQRPVASVTDQGPGIPLPKREQVLERFVRLASHDATGSGLGLSIVQRVCSLIGATLTFSDGPLGRGMRVSIRFMNPASPAPAPITRAGAATHASMRGATDRSAGR